MSVDTVPKVDQEQNPFPTPEKQQPSDYGSVEEYVQNVTPEEFEYHCIEKAIATTMDPKHHDQCMCGYRAMAVLYFAVDNDPYLKAAKEQRPNLDDVIYNMDENPKALGVLEVLFDIRKKLHKH